MTEMMTVQTPADVEKELPVVVSWARNLAITTPDDFTDAGERLKQIKGMAKRITDFFRPMKQAQDEAKRRILDAEKKLATPLEEAEGLAKREMLRFQQAEEEKAEAERRRLQAEADDKARREREALEKRAAESKKPETIQKYQEAAAAVVAPVVAVATVVPRVAGISNRKTWKAEVVDRKALLEFIYANKRDDLVIVNEKIIEAYAKAMGSNAQMPGVRFFEASSMASGGYR